MPDRLCEFLTSPAGVYIGIGGGILLVAYCVKDLVRTFRYNRRIRREEEARRPLYQKLREYREKEPNS